MAAALKETMAEVAEVKETSDESGVPAVDGENSDLYSGSHRAIIPQEH